jgi:hypothetical protein
MIGEVMLKNTYAIDNIFHFTDQPIELRNNFILVHINESICPTCIIQAIKDVRVPPIWCFSLCSLDLDYLLFQIYEIIERPKLQQQNRRRRKRRR